MSIDRRIQRTPSHSAAKSSQEWNIHRKNRWGPIIPHFWDPNRCGRYWGGNLFMLGLRMFEFMEWKQFIQRTVERASHPSPAQQLPNPRSVRSSLPLQQTSKTFTYIDRCTMEEECGCLSISVTGEMSNMRRAPCLDFEANRPPRKKLVRWNSGTTVASH